MNPLSDIFFTTSYVLKPVSKIIEVIKELLGRIIALRKWETSSYLRLMRNKQVFIWVAHFMSTVYSSFGSLYSLLALKDFYNLISHSYST